MIRPRSRPTARTAASAPCSMSKRKASCRCSSGCGWRSATTSPSCRQRECRSPRRAAGRWHCAASGIPLLVLHDFDSAGIIIKDTLENDTRRYSYSTRPRSSTSDCTMATSTACRPNPTIRNISDERLRQAGLERGRHRLPARSAGRVERHDFAAAGRFRRSQAQAAWHRQGDPGATTNLGHRLSDVCRQRPAVGRPALDPVSDENAGAFEEMKEQLQPTISRKYGDFAF